MSNRTPVESLVEILWSQIDFLYQVRSKDREIYEFSHSWNEVDFRNLGFKEQDIRRLAGVVRGPWQNGDGAEEGQRELEHFLAANSIDHNGRRTTRMQIVKALGFPEQFNLIAAESAAIAFCRRFDVLSNAVADISELVMRYRKLRSHLLRDGDCIEDLNRDWIDAYNNVQDWIEEIERRELVEIDNSTMTLQEVAKELDCSEKTVRRYGNELGLVRKKEGLERGSYILRRDLDELRRRIPRN